MKRKTKTHNVDYEADDEERKNYLETPTKSVRSKSTSSKYSQRLRGACFEYSEDVQ
jgi:hypothetical protein